MIKIQYLKQYQSIRIKKLLCRIIDDKFYTSYI